MYSCVRTAVVAGIEALPVRVEADVSDGLPVFEMVGFLGSEVREARERVRTALKNSDFLLPVKRVTVNLSPADLKKNGAGFDLAIALAILSAIGYVPPESLTGMLVAGEIGLDGAVLPIRGILPIVTDAAKDGIRKCLIPWQNRAEGALSEESEILPVKTIKEAVAYLNGTLEIAPVKRENVEEERPNYPDFSELQGQKLLKRACEVAVAGRHNLLMVGSAGAGKTMAAKRIPSILPPMSYEERLELSKIQSVAGLMEEKTSLSLERPFRAPHHTITPQGMAGGGSGIVKPGEISLAHNGVLFLDELTEFMPATLELLRQPLEEQEVRLVRSGGNFRYPADFMLVCAMNPCACGEYPDMNRCRCTRAQLDRYIGRISKPILDRIDICVEIPRVSFPELTKQTAKEESSEAIRNRILAARERQKERFRGEAFRYNANIPAAGIKKYIGLGEKEQSFMEDMFTSLSLSARGYHKVLKVARTVADLAGHENVQLSDLTEAACYRSLDRHFWER